MSAFPVQNGFSECCLSLFRLLSQNTTDWVVYKEQTCISYSSGGWETQGHGASRYGEVVIEGPLPGSRMVPLAVSSHGGRDQGLLWASLIRH